MHGVDDGGNVVQNAGDGMVLGIVSVRELQGRRFEVEL